MRRTKPTSQICVKPPEILCGLLAAKYRVKPYIHFFRRSPLEECLFYFRQDAEKCVQPEVRLPRCSLSLHLVAWALRYLVMLRSFRSSRETFPLRCDISLTLYRKDITRKPFQFLLKAVRGGMFKLWWVYSDGVGNGIRLNACAHANTCSHTRVRTHRRNSTCVCKTPNQCSI